MNRRNLVTVAIVAAVAWPRGAGAQQPELPVIGYLSNLSPEAGARTLVRVRQGLEGSRLPRLGRAARRRHGLSRPRAAA